VPGSTTFDDEIIAAALLHGTAEDDPRVTNELMVEQFGESIGKYVELVMNLEFDKSYEGIEDIAKNSLGMMRLLAEPWKAEVLKYPDRLENLRCLPVKQNPRRTRSTIEKTLTYMIPYVRGRSQFFDDAMTRELIRAGDQKLFDTYNEIFEKTGIVYAVDHVNKQNSGVLIMTVAQ
jgi:hypothetical protein